ncbi:biotin/lipoyl-containing protein [Sphingomonas sp.]|uniref:biotin/lipoyl-containing protein n=1 Tax=Sphingomonas sp. TaxID=28214 RepID=UPI0035C7F21E
MAVSVFFPNVGMGISDGDIVKWHAEVGDRVEAGAILVEIESAKSTVEVEAPASGTLTQIFAQVEDTVEVGAEIATIEEG